MAQRRCRAQLALDIGLHAAAARRVKGTDIDNPQSFIPG
jgi:hypothetical protein